MQLPDDCIRRILFLLPSYCILALRRLTKEMNKIVDRITIDEWRLMYFERVGVVNEVSASFDWKRALVNAEKDNTTVEAICVWNKKKVSIIAPWKNDDSICKCNNSFIIDADLHSGVSRNMNIVDESQGVCIVFVYDNAFELRGVRKTCLRRGEEDPCRNCNLKKRCENQQYSYFLRKLDHPIVNDLLCMRIKRVIM